MESIQKRSYQLTNEAMQIILTKKKQATQKNRNSTKPVQTIYDNNTVQHIPSVHFFQTIIASDSAIQAVNRPTSAGPATEFC